MTTETNEAPQTASAEQAADLAALEAGAGIGQADDQQAATSVQAQQVADPQDLFNVLQMVRDMAAPAVDGMGLLPVAKVEAIWTDAALLKLAKPLAEIMRRHGLGLDDAMEKYGPYIMLAVGLWGPAMATWRAMQLHAQEVAAAAVAKAKAAAMQPAEVAA